MLRESEQAEWADRCVVRFWRGYVSGQFQVFAPGGGAPFLCSAPFRLWRPPWRPRVPLEASPAAADAFRVLADELARRGWRPAGTAESFNGRIFVREVGDGRPGTVNGTGPASMPDELLLRALDLAAGEHGATAAEVGRALYGDDAASVRGLPQRVGSRLRSLQLQGKVDRLEADGTRRWFPRHAAGEDDGVPR